MERLKGFGGTTVNGLPVRSAYLKLEGDRWRWIIRTKRSTHVDGGNYTTREAAELGARAAVRDHVGETLEKIAETLRVAKRAGEKAFDEGRSAAAAQDSTVMDLVAAYNGHTSQVIAILDAFIAGWHGRNAAKSSAPKPHATDADCGLTIDADGTCTVCQVFHGDPCVECGGRAYHFSGCVLSDATPYDDKRDTLIGRIERAEASGDTEAKDKACGLLEYIDREHEAGMAMLSDAQPCGHSVCSQNYIDTGSRECVA